MGGTQRCKGPSRDCKHRVEVLEMCDQIMSTYAVRAFDLLITDFTFTSTSLSPTVGMSRLPSNTGFPTSLTRTARCCCGLLISIGDG